MKRIIFTWGLAAGVIFTTAAVEYSNDFSRTSMGSWKSKKSVGKFLHNKNDGHNAKGCLEIITESDNPKKSSFCFLKHFAVKPGKTYNAIVWIKVLKTDPDSNFYLGIQGQDKKKHFLGLPPVSVKLKGENAPEDWKRMVLTFTVPSKGKWAEAAYLLCTIGMNNNKDGQVLFDDFSFFESEKK